MDGDGSDVGGTVPHGFPSGVVGAPTARLLRAFGTDGHGRGGVVFLATGAEDAVPGCVGPVINREASAVDLAVARKAG